MKERMTHGRSTSDRCDLQRSGVTHVVHLLGGDGLPMAWREFRRSCHPNPPCDQHEYSRLIESLPEAWLITLRDAVLNRPRPIDWQECVRTSDLPGNAWTCMNDNGQGRRWVAPTQGEAPVFEWMETGELRATTQDETGAPSLATVRERGAGGWCEVEVWEDGGQSSASVTREEWGPESRRARADTLRGHHGNLRVGVRRAGDKGGPHAAGRHDQRGMGGCG